MYRWIFDHVIKHSNPEHAHEAAVKALEVVGRIPMTRDLISATFAHTDTSSTTDLLPRPVKGKLGLAAGMDKDARAIQGMAALGFGFLEIGTVTPRPQPGNDRPRLWRLLETREIRNRMGFNNEGVDAAVARLQKLRSTKNGRSIVVGANIGKNKVTANEDAPSDYEICARKLAPLVDFLVINVSSPNTPGLRDLQSVETLRPIAEVTKRAGSKAAGRDIPVLVKIAPDLADEDVSAVAQMVKELGLAGVVAANTTINHTEGPGGVSGPRLKQRTLQIVSQLRAQLGDDHTIIAVGGISTVSDALEYLNAGADLLEAFTAFIYEGPAWPGKMNRGIAQVTGR